MPALPLITRTARWTTTSRFFARMPPISSSAKSLAAVRPGTRRSLCRPSMPARSTRPGFSASPDMAAQIYADKTPGAGLHGRACRPRRPSRSPRSVERFADDPAMLAQCVAAFHRIEMIETDITLAQVSLLEAIEAGDSRGRESEQFERRVAELVRASTDQSKSLTDRTRATAASARGMLGKTSEVAAAAEQSAVAMREAAQTAAGLIRAIEDARSEVESRRRRRDPRRRPGEPGREGQPGAVGPRRSDRIDPQPDPRHRRPDQSPRAQRHHRSGARRRCRPRLRGRRPGSEEPRLADRAGDRRHHRQDHRHPAGDPPDGRRQWLDPGHGRGSADLRRPHPRSDGAAGPDGDDDHRRGRRNRACRRIR